MLKLRVDGQNVAVAAGSTVLAALAQDFCTRRASDGTARGALCGMGVCYECSVHIDGRLRLACCTLVREGMEVLRG